MAYQERPLGPRPWTDQIVTTRRPAPPRGAPLVTFYNPNADSWLRTRDADLYRKLPEWIERPFDVRAVVPRRPG